MAMLYCSIRYCTRVHVLDRESCMLLCLFAQQPGKTLFLSFFFVCDLKKENANKEILVARLSQVWLLAFEEIRKNEKILF
jgi:hypothetical protein